VANTGTVVGGQSTTLVPHYACLKGNIYCFDTNDVENFVKRVKEVAREVDRKYKTKTSVKILETYRGAEADLKCDFIEKLRSVYQKHGVKVKFCERLLINCNNCLPVGMQSVNAGLGHTNIHTVNEALRINGLAKFTDILIDLIEVDHVVA
jgi:di/tripeptidase